MTQTENLCYLIVELHSFIFIIHHMYSDLLLFYLCFSTFYALLFSLSSFLLECFHSTSDFISMDYYIFIKICLAFSFLSLILSDTG